MTVKKKLEIFFWFDRYNLSKKTFFHQNSSKKKLYHQKDNRKMSLLLKYEVALMSTLAVIAVGKSLWQSFPSMILQSNPSLFLSHNGKLGRGSQSSSPSRREIRLLSGKKICAPPPINIQRYLFELSNFFSPKFEFIF